MQNTIDMGGKLPFIVAMEGEKLHINYDLSALQNQKLKQFLHDNLTIIAPPLRGSWQGEDCKSEAEPWGKEKNMYNSSPPPFNCDASHLVSLAPTREGSNNVAPFHINHIYKIKLKQNILVEFVVDNPCPTPQGGSNIIAPFFPEITIISPPYMRLSVMELRMLAQNANCVAPYSRINLPIKQNWYIKTDLHTHLTSQIKSDNLLEIATTHQAAYPAELLELLGIDTQDYATILIPSTPFAPAAHDMLACEQQGRMVAGIAISELAPQDANKLQQAMEIAIDEVISFDELERRIYRFRNPLTKNPKLIASTIAKIAADYANAGVEYTELAVTAALNPDWLEAALPALQEAHENGVTIKLLIGLPRSLPPSQILTQLKMVMFAASHPAIVGVDFLGYEANKTRNFAWALSHFARFAATHKHLDDFIIRVHAGENGKNPDNVLEVLQIAEKYGVRVRVGHATYGDADACLKLAQKLAQNGLLIMEFNPDSNLAMNNIDCATDLPIRKWAGANIPFVLASDGGGIYQTDAAQLFNAGIFAGLGETELNLMMQTEKSHIAYQQKLHLHKTEAFKAHYGDDANFIAQMREFQMRLAQQQNNFDFGGKKPLLIAGASGSSWGRISPAHQSEIKAGIEQLVATLDANKVAFVVGRIKPEGIGKVLEDALDAHYEGNPNAPHFDVVGLLSQQQNMPLIASHINHILPLHGELMSVPTQVTNLLKAHQGSAIYIGGSAFTRDFILCSQKLEVPFAVMAGVAGASGEKARILPSSHVFNDASAMLNWVLQQL